MKKILVLTLLILFITPTFAQSQPKQTITINKTYKLKKDTIGAFTEEGIKTAITLLAKGNNSTFNQYFDSDELFILHKNKEIIVLKVYQGYLLVKLKGEADKFFILKEVL